MANQKKYINQNCSDQKAISILKKIGLFKGLFDHEFDVLLELCHLKSFEKGDCIFSENDSAKSLYVILTGKVGFSTDLKGVIDIFSTGDVFGEMGVITSNARVANAISLTDDVTVLEVFKSDFDLLLGREPRVSYIIMKNMASELAERFVNVNVENFSVRTNQSPQVKNISMKSTDKQRDIVINPSKENAHKVTFFKISNFKNSSISVNDRMITSDDAFISLEEAKKGVTFKPNKTGLKKYSFDVEQSDDGIKVNQNSERTTVYVFIY